MGGSHVCQTGCDNHPQVCVDWCDAYAYCQSVGKRLCGKIGGGANGSGDFANASLSQWYNACVSDGANNAYPYGASFSPDACNGGDHGVGTTVPVGSMTSCQSSVLGYGGVYDLSGNVWEWDDSCDGPGQSAYCHLRGGSFYGNAYTQRCDNSINTSRGVVIDHVGFRCCS
jgi:formylglycine-generating enzyme required for sulfatase activity